LFAAEMKYLYDNGFKVIPMSDLGYDEGTNYMYMKKYHMTNNRLVDKRD
jgi:hypothetical protein